MAKGQGEMSKRAQLFSKGVVSSITDLMFTSVFFGFEFGFKDDVDKTELEAQKALREIGFSSFKRALYHLRSQGLIEPAIGRVTNHQLTSKGQRKIAKLFSQYRTKREWDKRLYFVNYDFPVSANSTRNRFRKFLIGIGCGLFQNSVWVTAINPQKQVSEFVAQNKLKNNLVIISSRGEGEGIGQLSSKEIIEEAYQVREINKEYQDFIQYAKKGPMRERKIFFYLAILKKDPQLPFELLPSDWLGRKAYEEFQKLTS